MQLHFISEKRKNINIFFLFYCKINYYEKLLKNNMLIHYIINIKYYFLNKYLKKIFIL